MADPKLSQLGATWALLAITSCVPNLGERQPHPSGSAGAHGGSSSQGGASGSGARGGASTTGAAAGEGGDGANPDNGGSNSKAGSDGVGPTGGSTSAHGGSTNGHGGDTPARGGSTTEQGGSGVGGEGNDYPAGAAGTDASNGGRGGEAGDTSVGGSAGAGDTTGSCADQSLVTSWDDELAGSLDASWTVWQYQGARHNSQSSPANHISLTDSPGALRYYVDPMTHVASWHDYAAYYDSPYYWYDPGLSVERDLGGSHWSLEVAVQYYVPNVINAAYHELAVHFDPSGRAGLDCYFDRFSNDDLGAGANHDRNVFFTGCRVDGTPVVDEWSEWAGLDTLILRYVRFVREGATFTISASPDNAAWSELVSITIPDAFLCSGQKVLISGASWFSPAGSYADYDYVHFSRAP